MVTIEQTIDIPADRTVHLSIRLPETVPTGKASIVLVFPGSKSPETPRSYEPKPFPSIEELKAEAAAKYAEMLETGIDPMAKFAATMKDVFVEDGVTYQQRMRDEWPN
jgi:hypothetical protein